MKTPTNTATETTTRYAATTYRSAYALNDSPVALAVRAAFDAAGYPNPHRVVYLDGFENVCRFGVASAAMLASVAKREVGAVVAVARECGVTA